MPNFANQRQNAAEIFAKEQQNLHEQLVKIAHERQKAEEHYQNERASNS